MTRTFAVINVKCGGCANTLKTALKDLFGEVAVNLDIDPREITLDVEEEDIPELREKLKKLGYPMADDELSKFESVTTTAKSFVSCAIGKINNDT